MKKCRHGCVVEGRLPKRIKFVFSGTTVNILMPPATCPSCAKGDWINDAFNTILTSKNAMGKKLVVNNWKGKLKVNWDAYFYLISLDKDERSMEDKANYLLIDLGFLSTKLEIGKYIIVDGGKVKNPYVGGGITLYFNNKEDALQYAKVKGGDIVRLGRIIKRGK